MQPLGRRSALLFAPASSSILNTTGPLVRMLWLFWSVAIWMVGCSDGAGPVAPGEGAPPSVQDTVLAGFADGRLAAAVRQAAGVIGDSATLAQLLAVTELHAPGQGIERLDGLQRLRRLRVLDLADNAVIDLSSLAALDSLAYLNLESNHVRDLAPLARLSNLRVLLLGGNAIEELDPLLNLPALESVELSGNPLSVKARETELDTLSARGVSVVYTAESAWPDGLARYKFLFYGTVKSQSTLLIGSLDGSPPSMWLPPDPGNDCNPAWSPDGNAVAFLSTRPDQYMPGRYLCVAPANGSSWRTLWDEPGGYGDLTWSPDGQWLAFTWRRSGAVQRSDVYRIPAAGGAIERLTESDGFDEVLAWSPDATRLVFRRMVGWPGEPVFTVTLWIAWANGTGLTQLTRPPSFSNDPSWSLDGRLILYDCGDGDGEICLIHSNGGAATNLTQNPSDDWGAAWSPDGRQIAFTSTREGADAGLYVMAANGAGVHRLAPALAGCDNPTWSWDGAYLGFVAVERGIPALYAVELATGEVLNLTQGVATIDVHEAGVIWSPR